MEKRFGLLVLISFLTLFAKLHAVPAKPGERIYIQPDGSTVTVRVYGDEFYHYYESIDGQIGRAHV